LEQLIEKINKYREKGDLDKLFKTMMELKVEVEGYLGKKINLDKHLDQVEKEIEKNGGKFN
jgi:hypothetical protein